MRHHYYIDRNESEQSHSMPARPVSPNELVAPFPQASCNLRPLSDQVFETGSISGLTGTQSLCSL